LIVYTNIEGIILGAKQIIIIKYKKPLT